MLYTAKRAVAREVNWVWTLGVRELAEKLLALAGLFMAGAAMHCESKIEDVCS
jgi:hypothetical protein